VVCRTIRGKKYEQIREIFYRFRAPGFRLGVHHGRPSVVAGGTYDAGVWIRTVNLTTSESWLELQWLNSGGGQISQDQSGHITSDQAFTQSTLTGLTAPVGAVNVRVRGIVYRLNNVPATDFHIFDDFSAVVVPEPSAILLFSSGISLLVWFRVKRRK